MPGSSDFSDSCGPAGTYSFGLSPAWCRVSLLSTDSTMLQLRCPEVVAHHNRRFLLLTADFQTAGRGQRGSSWEAAAGLNLLFGIRIRPDFLPAAAQFALSEVQALAVAFALDEYVAHITVKWPNDIYYKNQKIAGMLLEHELCGPHIASTITGVGININQRTFVSDAPNPVSLYQILGREVDREELLRSVCSHFEQLYDRLEAGGHEALHALYLSRLYRRQGSYPFQLPDGRRFVARIAGVTPQGMLRLADEAGRETLFAFKEVRFLSE